MYYSGILLTVLFCSSLVASQGSLSKLELPKDETSSIKLQEIISDTTSTEEEASKEVATSEVILLPATSPATPCPSPNTSSGTLMPASFSILMLLRPANTTLSHPSAEKDVHAGLQEVMKKQQESPDTSEDEG